MTRPLEDLSLQRYKDRKFNKLTIRKEFRREEDGRIVATCDCDCGKSRDIKRKEVLSGRTKSCGCLLHERGPVRKSNHYLSEAAKDARAVSLAPHQHTQRPRGGGLFYVRSYYAPRVLDDDGDGQGTGLLGPGESVRSSSD